MRFCLKTLDLQKNIIVEDTLRPSQEEQEKAEFIESYKATSVDEEFLSIAEEGMADYLKQLEK